jgi:hypothetical protein
MNEAIASRKENIVIHLQEMSSSYSSQIQAGNWPHIAWYQLISYRNTLVKPFAVGADDINGCNREAIRLSEQFRELNELNDWECHLIRLVYVKDWEGKRD